MNLRLPKISRYITIKYFWSKRYMQIRLAFITRHIYMLKDMSSKDWYEYSDDIRLDNLDVYSLRMTRR